MVQRVQNSGWGLFHGGCRAKPAISGLGVHGPSNNDPAGGGDEMGGRTRYLYQVRRILIIYMYQIRSDPNLRKVRSWLGCQPTTYSVSKLAPVASLTHSTDGTVVENW